MTRPTPATALGTALLLAALGPIAAPALAADECAAGLDRLGQQAAALEAAAPNNPAPVTQQEIAQLRALQQAAQGAAQKGNAPACQAILARPRRCRSPSPIPAQSPPTTSRTPSCAARTARIWARSPNW
ncbi:hypothetical protein [Azospirillum sp. INR13]|uniref:hypothetical protein n=1 Tax=Azospirillum sp. INR13 TaxID=2596919 RepID=UPI0021024B51|nr:hypothetical protein [Azospirillum sp. INR13]